MFRLFLLLLLSSSLTAQITYKKSVQKISLQEIIHPEKITTDFHPAMKYSEAPNHVDTRLEQVKKEMAVLYPRKKTQKVNKRSVVPPPEIVSSFIGNVASGGTPLDNSIGISNEGQVVSAINSSLQFKLDDGSNLRSELSLDAFTGNLGDVGFKFDPRIIYDAEQDRYIMIWLSGFDEDSSIVLCFSQTNELNGPWSRYLIDGNPEGDETWSDYPMIAITDKELFLTINLLRVGEFWIEGFDKTLLYQIDKESAYAGEDSLNMTTWSEILYEGTGLRNLHPVKSADEELENDIYFLSNRNFSMSNDSIFLLHVSGDQSSDPELSGKVLLADTPYGAPPNALQAVRSLATNDARVLDAFQIEDRIHFVGNTIDHDSGKAAIYNGFITELGGTENITTRIITNDSLEYGYPGLAWSGTDPSDDEAIIVALHSSEDINPGISALYQDNLRDLSDWTYLKEGENTFINMIGQGVERWGDYAGCQRRYNDGHIWVSGTYPLAGGRTATWISELSRPEGSGSKDVESVAPITTKVYPNPTSERVNIEVGLDSRAPLTINIYNESGQVVSNLFKGIPKKRGKLDFSFDIAPLNSGIYLVSVVQNDVLIGSKQFIVE